MVKRRAHSSANSMSSFVTGYLTPGAEHLSSSSPVMGEEYYQHHVVYSPNPQDYIYTQGISPRYEVDHTDHILDQPAQRQLYPVDDHERAALPMENRSPSWNHSTLEHWRRAQSQYQGSFQVFQHPENSYIDWPAHAIMGNQEPFPDQLIGQQQHAIYYTNSDTPAQNSIPSRPKGGRGRGTKLSENSNSNAQQVREIGGSCLRCWSLNETCSGYDPCRRCAQNKDCRKWLGCFRSFSHLGHSIIPPILANRLNMTSYKSWMALNARRTGQEIFPLPLSFGFGKVFDGFFGCEFTPVREESMFSFSVRPRKGETRCLLGLPIFPTDPPGKCEGGKSNVVLSSLTEWLRKTLGDKESMAQWRRACFPEKQDEWVSWLLEAVWEHSCRCWRVDNRNGQYHQANETLFYAWGMTVLATILSFQITVPPDKLGTVVNHLQPSRQTYTNSSRQINKRVKCVVFDIYQNMQQKVMSQLDAIVKNSKPMNDREWGNMHCVSILLIVVINQAQLSLRANYALAEREQRGEWEETKKQLEESEAAFRTLAHSFARLFRDKEKERKGRDSNAADDEITSRLLRILDQIQRQHRKDVLRYRKEKLGNNMDTNTWFSTTNRLRLFAYYFHALYGGNKS